MAQESIIIKLSDTALDELQRCSSREERGQKLLDLINTKVDSVEEWFSANMGGGLAKFERAVICTLLYREITGEIEGVGDIENIPQERPAEATA